MKNRRGSYVIFLTMLLSGILILTGAVIYAAGQSAIGSTARNFGRLWGRSLLAEYDRNLKDRYGLFAFYSDIQEAETKLDFYIDYTCSKKSYVSCKAESVSLDEFSLKKIENFDSQTKSIALAGILPKPIDHGEREPEIANGKAEAETENRCIRNPRILNGLPSAGQNNGLNLSELIRQVQSEATIEKLVAKTADVTYIFRFFRSIHGNEIPGETFLQNEIEYIVSGKPDDAKAKSSVRRILIALRNGLNLVYLYQSEEKRSAALAAAETIAAGGPGAVLLQALILESWALLEAENDWKILEAGEKVPFLKQDANWALSLENVMEQEFGDQGEINTEEIPEKKENYIRPPRMEGSDYTTYLRILVAALPQETRVLRMMDLIQINMKYLYCESFLLQDYYTGVRYKLRVNDKCYEFTETYETDEKKKNAYGAE